MTLPINPTLIPDHATAMPDPASETTFGARMRALFDWFVGAFVDGANLLAQNTYQNAQAAAEAAEAAIAVSGASVWNAATNYTTGQAAISEVNLQTYRRVAPGGVDATDPSASALWTLVGDLFLQKSGGTMTGNLVMTHQNIPSVRAYISASQYMNALPNNGGALAVTAPLFRNVNANSNTFVGAVPNGTGTESGFYCTSGNRWGAIKCDATGLKILTGDTNQPPNPVPIQIGPMTCYNTGNVSFSGTISAKGVQGYQGTSGAAPGNAINLFWTGTQLQAWVDTTNQGVVTLTSDYRVKKNVQTMTAPARARMRRLRPITYEYADYAPFNFKADGVVREGFLAHELAEEVSSGVEGEKDAPNQVQSLRLDPVVAVLTKAMQEQDELLESLLQQVAQLKEIINRSEP